MACQSSRAHHLRVQTSASGGINENLTNRHRTNSVPTITVTADRTGREAMQVQPAGTAPCLRIAALLLLLTIPSDAFSALPSNGMHNFAASDRQQTRLLAKKGGKRGKRSGGGGGRNSPAGRIVPETVSIYVDANGDDAWKTMDIVEIITRGGVGVVPTDTGYGVITTMDSKLGLERILRFKQQYTPENASNKKPLSVLCTDLPTIDSFCYGIDRNVFKILKKNLPGPYTFILPASTTLPKSMSLSASGGKQSWARSTVGIRMPKDPVLRYLQDDLLDGAPLLVSSIPKQLATGQYDEDDADFDPSDYDDDDDDVSPYTECSLDPGASWHSQMDFIVDAGPRPIDGSTIYDLTARGEPELIREGMGETALMS